jgi:membrane-associated phospholipid phosphatase
VRPFVTAVLLALTTASAATAQGGDTLSRDKTFLVRRDLGLAGVAIGATALLTRWDPDIARWSQTSSFHSTSNHDLALRISKVNETSLTVGGLLIYGIGRLTGQRTVADVALHASESVILASVASQLIRGPLGRSRPYVTADSNQYDFKFGAGFQKGEEGFRRRAFPSIHTSSSMAVATVLSMEMKRRNMRGATVIAPVMLAAGLLPGIARIQLDQHWASDVVAGAAMGIFAGYKVVNYSHAHPNNMFDRVLLKATVMPSPTGGLRVGFSPEI